jgi:nitroreductase
LLKRETAPLSSAQPPAPDLGTPLPQHAAPEVLRFLSLRRSTSALTLREPAPSPTQLQELLRLATRVPDHGKLSPWRFVLLQGPGKAAFADRLEALARQRGDAGAVAKLGKLKVPPLAVVVVSSPKPGPIPEWEQILSAGAVCTTLLQATLALGLGANWITDWYSYDPEARAILGLDAGERVAGFVLMGTPTEPPLERERPDWKGLISIWEG